MGEAVLRRGLGGGPPGLKGVRPWLPPPNFLTTYREEGLVGKLVCLYFLTSYGEEGLVGKLVCLYFLTSYGEEGLVGKLVYHCPLI